MVDDAETNARESKIKFISKGGYFKLNAELTLIDSYDFKYSMGLFEGARIATAKREIGPNRANKIGGEYIDQEKCGWDDITIVKEN